jgi:hypothetical protein
VLPPKAIHNARLLNPSLSRGFFYCLSLAATAWAVDPNRQITQYAHTAWRIQDGVLNGSQTQLLRLRMVIYGLERRLDSCVSMGSDSFHGSRRVERNCRHPTLTHSSVRAMGVYGSERLPG